MTSARTAEEPGARRRGRTVVATGPTRKCGWSYRHGGGATWNMTCGGASSLLLVGQNLNEQLEPAEQTKLAISIRDGLGWMMANWNPKHSYYGMYSLEKVADIERKSDSYLRNRGLMGKGGRL